jgi:hypothetical protein
MPLAKPSRHWQFLILLISLAGLYFVSTYLMLTVNRVRAYNTEAYMVRINMILAAAQPKLVDTTVFRELLRRNHAERYFLDGWGHPFVIECWKDSATRGNHYRIISLGRSGRRTSCCNRSLVHHWDLNIVMEDGNWLQR